MTAGKDHEKETAGPVLHHGHDLAGADGAALEAATGDHHWLVTRDFGKGSLGALGHVCGCEIGADHTANGDLL